MGQTCRSLFFRALETWDRMGTDNREWPVLPLSFGLLVVLVLLLGTRVFGIEWDSGQLALVLVVILLGVALGIAGRLLRD